MVNASTSRILRRLNAAEGYLELDLPGLALAELGAIEESGEYQVPVMWMTGQALKSEGRFEEAIAPLRFVIENVAGPVLDQARESLSECLAQTGRTVPRPKLETQPEQSSDHQASSMNPSSGCAGRRVHVEIPGVGLIKFVATGGSVTIGFEPLPSEPPE